MLDEDQLKLHKIVYVSATATVRARTILDKG